MDKQTRKRILDYELNRFRGLCRIVEKHVDEAGLPDMEVEEHRKYIRDLETKTEKTVAEATKEKPLRLLVVEDTPKQLADIKGLLEDRIANGIVLTADYCSTLKDVYEKLGKENYDGVLSDVFFPEDIGRREEENGTKVGEHALNKGVPVILVTSTYHHGRKTEPVFSWTHHKGMDLIDRDVSSILEEKGVSSENRKKWEEEYKKAIEEEALSKNWEGAYFTLMCLIEAKKDGIITISSKGVESFGEDKYIGQRACNLGSSIENGFLSDEIEKTPTFKAAYEKYCRGMFKIKYPED